MPSAPSPTFPALGANPLQPVQEDGFSFMHESEVDRSKSDTYLVSVGVGGGGSEVDRSKSDTYLVSVGVGGSEVDRSKSDMYLVSVGVSEVNRSTSDMISVRGVVAVC